MGTIYWNLVLSITIIRTRLLSFSLPSWPWLPPTNTATRASSMATPLLSLPPSIDPMVNITPLCTPNPLPLPMRFTNTTMRRNMLLVSTPLATTGLLTSTMQTMLPFIVAMPISMLTMPIFMVTMLTFMVTMPTFTVTMPTFTVTMPTFMVTMVLPTTSTVTPLTMLMLKPTPTSTPTLLSTTKLLSTILPLSTSLLLSTTLPPLSTNPLLSPTPLPLFTKLPPTNPLTLNLLTMSLLMKAQLSINTVMLSLMTTLVTTLLKVRTVMVLLPLANTV